MEAGHAGACPAVHSWSVMKYREDLHTPNPRLRNANNVGSELPQLAGSTGYKRPRAELAPNISRQRRKRSATNRASPTKRDGRG